jgi:Tfp pilus assembly protein PilF
MLALSRTVRALALAAACAAAGCASSPETEALDTLRDGVLAAREGDLERSVELLEQAHQERPGFIDPLMFLANVHERRGDPAAARDAYERALAIDATFSAAAVALALTYLSEENPAEARRILEATLQGDPGFEPTVFNLGTLSESEGDPAQAAEWYRVAAALDGTSTQALVRLGALHLAAGRPDVARALADQALNRRPGDPAATQLRAAAGAP